MGLAETVQQNVSIVLSAYAQAQAIRKDPNDSTLRLIKNSIDVWKSGAYAALNSGEPPAGDWEKWIKIGETIAYQLNTIAKIRTTPTLIKIKNAVERIPQSAVETADIIKEGTIDFAQGVGDVATAGALAIAKPAAILAGVGAGLLLLIVAFKNQFRR